MQRIGFGSPRRATAKIHNFARRPGCHGSDSWLGDHRGRQVKTPLRCCRGGLDGRPIERGNELHRISCWFCAGTGRCFGCASLLRIRQRPSGSYNMMVDTTLMCFHCALILHNTESEWMQYDGWDFCSRRCLSLHQAWEASQEALANDPLGTEPPKVHSLAFSLRD